MQWAPWWIYWETWSVIGWVFYSPKTIKNLTIFKKPHKKPQFLKPHIYIYIYIIYLIQFTRRCWNIKICTELQNLNFTKLIKLPHSCFSSEWYPLTGHMYMRQKLQVWVCDLLVGTRHYPPYIKLLKGVKYVQS